MIKQIINMTNKIIVFIIILSGQIFCGSTEFKKGVNLASWFQENDVRNIQFTKFTKDDFIDIKSLGIDHIRLPLNLEYMTNGSPDYVIDPLFFFLLDEVIIWAEELELHLILDNHTFDVTKSTPLNYDEVLIPIWKQMAQHLKGRSNYIYYEILNEPHGIDDVSWNNIQLKVIDEIRKIDAKHTIIVGPAGWNSYNNLNAMPVYADTNLIYTFHFYDPFLFTHQGASWTVPSLEPLINVPFPYSAEKMPAFPAELKNTWVEGSFYNNYKIDGKISSVTAALDIAKKFSDERNVPVHCGEFGVYMRNSDNNSRIWWHSVVVPYLESLNIAWTIWDYKGDFGLFEKESQTLFDFDLNVKLLEAMKLNVPHQREFIIIPDSSGFDIYSDYVGRYININSWSGSQIDYYSVESVNENGYGIYWSGASRYNSIRFDFLPDKDFSYLVNNNYEIDFWIKAKGNVDSLEIRFLDTKTNTPGDRPWRIGYLLSPFDYQTDNNWYHLQIPLKYFSEKGAWDNNSWYNPINAFDWKAIDLFEITSEYKDFNGAEIWFDEIKIINPNAVSVNEEVILENKFQLSQNYPNPFNPVTTISFTIPNVIDAKIASATLKIYDVLGREVTVLLNETLLPGKYELKFDASNLSSGIYFYQLRNGNFIDTKKLILLK